MICTKNQKDGKRMIPNAVLRPRDFYLNRLAAFQDTEPVKIITGMRSLNNSNAFEYPPCGHRPKGAEPDNLSAQQTRRSYERMWLSWP